MKMLFSDEVERRNQGTLTKRMLATKVDHNQVLERFDWDAQITLDRDRLKGLISLDFSLERLTPEQAHDFYEIISERYERGATIITSNRHVAEWVSLFDDQIIANSAPDRLAHNAHQMIIEGESYRKRKGTIGSKL